MFEDIDSAEGRIFNLILTLLGAMIMLLLAGYAVTAAVTWTAMQSLPPIVPTVDGLVHLPWHLDHPANAFAESVRRMFPEGADWAWSGGLAAATMLLLAAAALVHVDRLRGRQRIALRKHDPRRRVTPRSFARPRDLEDLRDDVPDSWTTLRLDGRWIRTAPETHMLLVAPTGAGKTTGPVATWILEHRGPVVATSMKRDIVDITAGARLGDGPVWVFAPGVPEIGLPLPACGWTPLSGCRDWEYAQLMGGWIAATNVGGNDVSESDAARFYNHEAGRLLAPLLHAAAIACRDMRTVNGWLRGETMWVEPLGVLRDDGASHASDQLDAYRYMDARPRSLVITSAGQLIDAYELESIARSDRHDFDPDRLLEGGGTLYLIAPEALQQRVRPIFAGLLGAVFRAAEMKAMRDGRPLDPHLRCVFDETRRLAAIDDLPGLTSMSRGWGVRIATVWQSLGQIRGRYGADADELKGNSLAKLILGPIQDRETREELVALLDVERTPDTTYDIDGMGGRTASSIRQREQNKVTPQSLQQLRPGEALLIHGHSLPAKGRVTRWFERRSTRRQVRDGQRALSRIRNERPQPRA